MTPEEVWRDAMGAHNVAFRDERDGCPFTAAEVAAVSVIRTAMEAYAAEKVAEVREWADQRFYLRDKFIVDQGLWDAFLSTLLAVNQHHGGNDADT